MGTEYFSFGLRAIKSVRRAIVDPGYRGSLWLRLRRPRHAFQASNITFYNRYPRIFMFMQSRLGREFDGRILSFGCSTGEEVFSLRHYFPHAFIEGIDINRGNIASCRKLLRRSGDPRIAFERGQSTTGEATASYDAILCMAVFKQSALNAPGVTRCDHLIRFADFSRAIDDFVRCLKPGGLLVIRNCNFRLCDTPQGRNFDTLLQVPNLEQQTPFFGPDNRLLEGVVYDDMVFQRK